MKVKLLASFADRFGQREVELAHVRGMTVKDAWAQATAGAPVLPNTLSAVNFEYCALQAAVNDGDEVAFFPPVTGG
ncbi:MAG: MoaD/ThiS family protein [Chromatiales bacterium]